MKRTLTLLLSIGVGLALVPSTYASLLFTDAFDYTTPGNLGGNVNPDSGYTWGPGNNNMTIASGSLSYPGIGSLGGNMLSLVNGSAGSITNGFANITSGTVYYSFLLDVAAAPTGNSYLTSLNPGTSTPNGSSDAITMYVYSASSGYRLGLRTAGVSAVTTPTDSPFAEDATYFITMAYNFDTDYAYLWVNPTYDGEGSPTLSLLGSGSPTSIDNVGFKTQGTAGASYLVDDLRIGTAWIDVVPEPSSLTLLGLGALGMAIARRARR